MKILAIGDVHCSLKTISKVNKLADFIIKTAKDAGVPDVVVLGDLHDTFEKAHQQAFNTSCDFLKTLADNLNVYYVVGNHDLINNASFLEDTHFFKALKGVHRNLHIIDQKFKVSNLLFMPYVPPGRFWEAIGEDRLEYIFCHQEFLGAKMGAIESKHGDPTYQGEYKPWIISGHIHDHQYLDNALYVGAPMHLGFGDKDEKTISLLTLDGGHLKEERIVVPLPKKISLNMSVNDDNNINELPEETNNEVRLLLSGKTEEIAAFKKSKKYKNLSKCYKIVFKPEADLTVKKSFKSLGYIATISEMVHKEPKIVQELFEEVNRNAFGLK